MTFQRGFLSSERKITGLCIERARKSICTGYKIRIFFIFTKVYPVFVGCIIDSLNSILFSLTHPKVVEVPTYNIIPAEEKFVGNFKFLINFYKFANQSHEILRGKKSDLTLKMLFNIFFRTPVIRCDKTYNFIF